jgi:hypothetical protein
MRRYSEVEGMAGTMQKVGLQFDLSPVGTRFAHHKLQIYAALCKVAMQVNLESCGMIGIKAALKNLEKHIVEVSTLIVGPDGKDAVAGAREWFAASVTFGLWICKRFQAVFSLGN